MSGNAAAGSSSRSSTLTMFPMSKPSHVGYEFWTDHVRGGDLSGVNTVRVGDQGEQSVCVSIVLGPDPWVVTPKAPRLLDDAEKQFVGDIVGSGSTSAGRRRMVVVGRGTVWVGLRPRRIL